MLNEKDVDTIREFVPSFSCDTRVFYGGAR